MNNNVIAIDFSQHSKKNEEIAYEKAARKKIISEIDLKLLYLHTDLMRIMPADLALYQIERILTSVGAEPQFSMSWRTARSVLDIEQQ